MPKAKHGWEGSVSEIKGGGFPVPIFIPGAPGAGSEVEYLIPFDRQCYIPSGASGTSAKANTAATGSAAYSLRKNGAEFGTMNFSASGTVPTFSIASNTPFNGATDYFSILAPASPDATLKDIGIMLRLMLGAPPASGVGIVYNFGGYSTTQSGYISSIRKYDISTNSWSTLSASLSQARGFTQGVGNYDKAVIAGGSNGSPQATTEKLTYATEAIASISSISPGRWLASAFGNTTEGFILGGYVDPNPSSSADKITYSTDARAAATALHAVRSHAAAAGNSAKAFVGIGSITGGYSQPVTSFSEYTYSTEASQAGAAAFGTGRTYPAATGNGVFGVWAGGYNVSANSNLADKLVFSTGAISALSVISSSRHGVSAAGTTDLGVFSGGNTDGGRVTTVEGFTYSTEAWSTLSVSPIDVNGHAASCSTQGGL